MSRYSRLLCSHTFSASLENPSPPSALLDRNKALRSLLLLRSTLRSEHADVVSLFHERSSSFKLDFSMLLTNPEKISSVIAHYERFKDDKY